MDNYSRILAEVLVVLGTYPTITFTLRQMYYRLVAKQVIPNTLNEYKKLSRYMVKARENGEVDDDRFEDRARRVLGTGDTGYGSGEKFIEAQKERFLDSYKHFSYRQWLNQEEYLEVWLEKDALSTLFNQVANPLNVHTCPARGYPSYSYVMKAVERFWRAEKPIVILYFGDYDPSGLNIPENLIKRFRQYGQMDEDEISIERIALNIKQIRQYDLPPAPAKKSDSRFASFVMETGSDDVVELDALEPNVLQELIKDAITNHIDIDLWNAIVEKSDRMREKLKTVFDDADIDIEDVEEEEDD